MLMPTYYGNKGPFPTNLIPKGFTNFSTDLFRIGEKLYDKADKYINGDIDALYNARNDLSSYLINTPDDFETYVRDAYLMGYIDLRTYKDGSNAWTKFRNNITVDKNGTLQLDGAYESLNKKEKAALTTLYKDLYNSDDKFINLIYRQYNSLDPKEKLEWLKGLSGSNATIPAPAYLDTSFKNYQKEVAPLKLYSNKELADLYNLDFDFENIKKDYETAGQADVDYSTWASELLGNAAERNNTATAASYLDAIRNIKSEAVLKGMSNGARAAAELLANSETVQNKVNNNMQTALTRYQTMNDALLNRAQAAINATSVYNNLAKNLGQASSTLYANDVNRLGADLLANANFFSADENLRSNRMAQNNLMSAMYENNKASLNASNNNVNNIAWLMENVYLPKNDYNWRRAENDLIGAQLLQGTGYDSVLDKYGAASSMNK